MHNNKKETNKHSTLKEQQTQNKKQHKTKQTQQTHNQYKKQRTSKRTYTKKPKQKPITWPKQQPNISQQSTNTT